MHTPTMDERAQVQWPGRWEFNDGYWCEKDPIVHNPRMVVDATAMEYLLKQVPEGKKKFPKVKIAR